MHLVMALLLQVQTEVQTAVQAGTQTGAPTEAQAAAAQAAKPPADTLERIRRRLESPPATVTIPSSDPNRPPVFRLEVRERPLPYEHLWQGDYASAHIRPIRGLTHHEFLEQVTPDLFRATAMYPCCDVLPAINFLRKKVKSDGQAKARREVQKALKEFREQQQKENADQRLPDAK
jgi:hypothetical protein